MTRTEFLAERKTGIGSSDAASLMNVGWGCKRRLWYDKVGVPADYPFDGNKLTRLGNALEPMFRKEYEAETGRAVSEQDAAYRHPTKTYLLTHLDGTIFDKAFTGAGVLEIKSLGRAMFYKTKREGVSEDYILQTQWSMMCTGAGWGSFAIGNRDSGDLLYFDFKRNELLCGTLEQEGVAFWALVQRQYADDGVGPQDQLAPPRLSPDDARCHRCEWRDTCQGNALMEISEKDNGDFVPRNDLLPLYTEYKERKKLLQQAEDLVEEAEEELKTKIGDAPRVTVNGRKVYYAPQDTWRWPGEELADYVERLRKALAWAQNQFGEEFEKEWPRPAKKCSRSRPFRPY